MLMRWFVQVRPQWLALLAVALGAGLGVGLVCLARQGPPRPVDVILAGGLILYVAWTLHVDGRRATAGRSTGCPWCDAGFSHGEPHAPGCCRPPF